MSKLIEVTHVSKKGTSMRIGIPKVIQKRLGLEEKDIIGYYEDENKVVIRKIE